MHVLTILGYIMLETDRPWLLAYGRVLICTTTLRLIKIARNSKMIVILIDTFMLSMPSISGSGRSIVVNNIHLHHLGNADVRPSQTPSTPELLGKFSRIRLGFRDVADHSHWGRLGLAPQRHHTTQISLTPVLR